MASKEGNYLEGLYHRVDEAFTEHRLHGTQAFKARMAVRGHIKDVFEDIQHRLHQHVIAEMCDIAKQINPKGKR